MSLRRALDALYFAAAILAGVCLVFIAVLVLAQIGGRAAGIFVRGADQIVGYLLAASTFLALAHTFATGGHIRIELLLETMPKRLRHAFEIACLTAATGLIGYFAWHASVMTWQSHQFRDIAPGLIAMPLWIPQIAVSVGLWIMFVAVLDGLVTVLLGRRPIHLAGSARDLRT
ncbi:MAG: TRAP transporter small permease [Alphaproteobacteria bacterium]